MADGKPLQIARLLAETQNTMSLMKKFGKINKLQNKAKDAVKKLKLKTKGFDSKSASNLVENAKKGIISPRDPQSGLPTGKTSLLLPAVQKARAIANSQEFLGDFATHE